MTDQDYKVFRLSARKSMPVLAMGFWPILAALLPIIWEIVKLIFKDRFEQDGPDNAYEALRSDANRASRQASRAYEAAKREVLGR